MIGYYLYRIRFFFFFQAEDGIRVLTVTGVQTCALPISSPLRLTGAAVQLGLKRGKESHPPRDRPERKGCASKNQTRTVWLCLPKILCSPRWKRSEEHTSELQSQSNLVCRLLLEKKKKER